MARARSPNYPQVGLKTAIDLVRKVYDKEHTHKASPEVVAKALGYSGINGRSLGVLSALKKFGLLEEVGEDLKVSSDALTILVDPKDSPDRSRAIAKSAFLPNLFSTLREQYGDTYPSDENLKAYLLKNGFTQSAVDAPIAAYRETVDLVKEIGALYTSDSESGKGRLNIGVGDFVQWQANGTLRLPQATRVRAISDDKQWLFIEGSETGIPMKEAILEKKDEATPGNPPPPTLSLDIGSQPSSKEREWLRGPLSMDSAYRLLVMGDMGPDEIESLIEILTAQKKVLTKTSKKSA